MIKLDEKTGLSIEELNNNFLGKRVTYLLWSKNVLIATSTDKENWKLASWARNILSEKKYIDVSPISDKVKKYLMGGKTTIDPKDKETINKDFVVFES